jgi:hypothetical protein
MSKMTKVGFVLLIGCGALLSLGCARKPATGSTTLDATPGSPVTSKTDPVIDTGKKSAVLSLHVRKATPKGCGYGMTLTNNLAKEIKRFGLQFGAYNHKDVELENASVNFFGIRPTGSQYMEITYSFTCDQIAYLKVIDQGHCAGGPLEERAAEPGQCLSYVELPLNPYVQLRAD